MHPNMDGFQVCHIATLFLQYVTATLCETHWNFREEWPPEIDLQVFSMISDAFSFIINKKLTIILIEDQLNIHNTM